MASYMYIVITGVSVVLAAVSIVVVWRAKALPFQYDVSSQDDPPDDLPETEEQRQEYADALALLHRNLRRALLLALVALTVFFLANHKTTFPFVANLCRLVSTSWPTVVQMVSGVVILYAAALCFRQGSISAAEVRSLEDKRRYRGLSRSAPVISAGRLPQLVEQYKAYLQDLGNIGSRQAQTNAWYVSILSALLVFITFIAKEAAQWQYFAYVAVAASAFVGGILCVSWHFHAQSFQYLYNAKFTVLREMEGTTLPFDCYSREQRLLDPRRRRFTNLERFLTAALSIPFLVLLILAVSELLA